MKSRFVSTVAWQLAICIAILAIWQWGYSFKASAPMLVPNLLDPYFISKPSEIWKQFLNLSCLAVNGKSTLGTAGAFNQCLAHSENNLWVALLVTLQNTFFAFVVGVATGFGAGLVLGRSDRLSAIFQPFIAGANAIPRIALAPVIILAFGIGDVSKVVTAWFIVVFVVFFNTYAGARAVERDHINAARLLGASEWQITRTVIVPSTLAWLFASLSPAIAASLIGVIVGEFIGAERGVGRMIIEAEARGEAAGMMVAIIVLMIVGVLLTAVMDRVQRRLLRWQPQHQLGT